MEKQQVKNQELFLPFFYATLIWGIITTESLVGPVNVISLGILTALAHICQSMLFGTKYFALDRIVNERTVEDEEIFFRGSNFKTNRNAETEQQYLQMTFLEQKRWGVRGAQGFL